MSASITAFLTTFAIYFIVWWVTLFTVLPWFNTSAHESGIVVEEGHAPSAPLKPNLLLKFGLTTVISALVFGIGYFVVTSSGLRLEDVPFMPEFRSYSS